MKAKNILIGLAVLAAIVMGYIAGFRAGPGWEMGRSEKQYRVLMDLSLYQLLQQGATPRAQGQVSAMLLGDTRDYERLFGVPEGTNTFARRFVEASSLANQIERTLVPISSIATNLGTNITLKLN